MHRSSLAVAVLLSLAAIPIFSPQEARAAPADSSAIVSTELVPAPSLATVESVVAFSGTSIAQTSAASVIAAELSPSVASAAIDVGSRGLAYATSDWGLALVTASILIGLALLAGPSDYRLSKRDQPGARSTRHDLNLAGVSASG